MNELVFAAPYLALICGAALLGRALQFSNQSPMQPRARGWRLAFVLLGLVALPSISHAQTPLTTAVEAGNAIIMYLCGVFAAVGIVTAGVSMMTGRPTMAKWAFAGAMVSGLGFAIVKTMWTNFGLTPADVSTFAP